MFPLRLSVGIIVLVCTLSVEAQFGFFDQMFGHGQQQQQQQQRHGGASQWAAQADAGKLLQLRRVVQDTCTDGYDMNCSGMLSISMPGYARVCCVAVGMPVSKCARYQMLDPRRS